ncbi:hypothetical protein CEXT_786971 [Caerostris extrusa]|uniref:Secreted protein n=1 Tax=Caerostris extrusa TaxID=172846 RepID=A0AAV4QKB3_CAEEX|nr:hypothetical protein CEXT_786971 [Caerostris extrusa]
MKFFFVGAALLRRAQRAAARKMNSFTHRKEVSPQRELIIYIIMFMRDWMYALLVTRISASRYAEREQRYSLKNDHFIPASSDLCREG